MFLRVWTLDPGDFFTGIIDGLRNTPRRVNSRASNFDSENGSYWIHHTGEIVSISIGSTGKHSLRSQSCNLRVQVFGDKFLILMRTK